MRNIVLSVLASLPVVVAVAMVGCQEKPMGVGPEPVPVEAPVVAPAPVDAGIVPVAEAEAVDAGS